MKHIGDTTHSCVAAMVVLCLSLSPAMAVTIDLTNPAGSGNGTAGESLDNLTSGNHSQDGLTLTATAVGGTGAFLRANNTGMGVNETGDGAPTQIDQSLSQAISIVFDVDVDILSIDLGSVGGTTDAARIQSGVFDLTIFDGEAEWDNSADKWTPLSPLNVPAGTALILSATGTSGTANARVNAQFIELNIVPEPASLAMLGLGGMALMRRWHSR